MPLSLDFLDEARETRQDVAIDAALAAPRVAAGPPAAIPIEPVDIPPILQHAQAFLCGPAGTGKTFLARHIAKTERGTVLAATTGIASVNLGEGTTINALLGYFDTKSLLESYTLGRLNARLGKLWRVGLRRIILDEVSMLDAEQLTILTKALDELAGRGYSLDVQLQDEIEATREDSDDPVSLMLVGDFAQLPPIKAPFAFESKVWEKYAAHTHTLTTIRRQSDPAFMAALMAARQGNPDGVIHFFRQRLSSATDPSYQGVTIFATNEAVDRHNAYRLEKLAGQAAVYASSRWGKERGDWKNIPEKFALKTGALVMLLANLREVPDPLAPETLERPLIYANGDLAEVVAMNGTSVFVKLQRNNREVEVEWVARQNTIPMEPGRRKALRDEGNAHLIVRDGRYECVGEVVYLPLRVAYASTVHKSQGLSLDHVQVNINEGFFKTPGMLYVALSRARTAEGLRLVGSIDGLRDRCTVHQKVLAYL